MIEHDAHGFRAGQRVVALVGTGGYAEYVAAPAATTFAVPDGVDDGTAVALLLQGLTAWHLLRTSAHMAPGESVVVHAAAGGVGSLAVQLAKPLGAGRVIATASTEEKRALALELGADAAVDVMREDLTAALVEANLGGRVDIVLEMAGGRVFEASLDALAPFGRLVTYGIASRERNTVTTGSLMRKSRAVVGFWLAHCLRRPAEMIDAPLQDLFERAARRRAAGRRGCDVRALGGPARPRGPRGAPDDRQAADRSRALNAAPTWRRRGGSARRPAARRSRSARSTRRTTSTRRSWAACRSRANAARPRSS